MKPHAMPCRPPQVIDGLDYYLGAMIEKKEILFKYVGGDIGAPPCLIPSPPSLSFPSSSPPHSSNFSPTLCASPPPRLASPPNSPSLSQPRASASARASPTQLSVSASSFPNTPPRGTTWRGTGSASEKGLKVPPHFCPQSQLLTLRNLCPPPATISALPSPQALLFPLHPPTCR